MHSTVIAAVLAFFVLFPSPLAFGQSKEAEPLRSAMPAAQSNSRKSDETIKVPERRPVRKSRGKRTARNRRARPDHFSQPQSLPIAPFTLVSTPPEYLSGEANVTVKGNENPIIRLGLAMSGVTLVEFPASDRFFALHPGNSDMVTIDESPTKQNDHFFVFRAGTGFAQPRPGHAANEPSASIMAQMRSGMVVTFLIYPVRELTQMAHRVVILYDRADVVAARRAAGLAVDLEEAQRDQQEHSIRIAPGPDTIVSRSNEIPSDARPRTVKPALAGPPDGAAGATSKTVAPANPTEPGNSPVEVDRDLEAEARKALKLAITSSKPKNWTHPIHGLSIATATPKEFSQRDGSAIVIVAVSNVLPEPLKIVPGQPELSVETRDEQGKKTLLVERVKLLHIECSGFGDSIPAGSVLYYAIVYRRPVLGAHQHLRVAVGQINAADEPAVADLSTTAR